MICSPIIFSMDEMTITSKSEESIESLVKPKGKEDKQWSLSNWDIIYPIA